MSDEQAIRDAFKKASIEAGYGKPSTNALSDGYIYERDHDRFCGFEMGLRARAALASRVAQQSMSPVEVAKHPDFFTKVCDLIGIGALARTESIAMMNISNALRRSDCLSGIENLFSFEIEVDDEEEESNIDDLLNWGQNREQYIETFKAALVDPRVRALGVITYTPQSKE